MFSCVWLHFKKIFGKYFLMFGCVLENTIENTFSTCCSRFLTFSQLPNKHIMSFIPKITNKSQKWSHFLSEIAISAISIGEITIAIAWSVDRECAKRWSWDRDLTDLDDRDRRRSVRSRAITIVIARSVDRDRDRRSSGDRDRGASVWIVPFGSVCELEQSSFERGSACVREECVWERGGKRLKWK